METMAEDEHFMLTDLEWDPTGRYVCTSVSYWMHQSDNGFRIWSFSGKLLNRTMREKMYQFMWRPRPPTLLSLAKEKEIRKNLKKYSEKYEKEDEELKSALSAN